MILRDSIRARLLGLAALLIGAALIAGYLVIAAILDRFVTDRFDAEAETAADALMATATIDPADRLLAGVAPIAPRFDLPLSGWYWQLEQDGRVMAKSGSLYDGVLAAPDGDYVGSGMAGPDGAPLRLLRHEFSLPDSTSALAVVVALPRAEIDDSLSRVRRPLAISLAVLGLALALASIAQVAAGLRSLDRLGKDLRAIRAGRADALPLPRVAELRPLAVEMNGLIEQNRQVLARTREHVGNLAHSLKTPLAALDNALPADHPGHALVMRMDRQIGWHLRRARSSGTPRALGQRSPVAPVIEDILLVLHRPIQESGLDVHQDLSPDLAFAGERQDLEEMIGNLIENAVKWANRRILIRATAKPDARLSITIADDGPGMSPEDHALALARGGRLDESGPPGTGLGLAIVADLAALNGGELRLERAKLGGLSAQLVLPG